MHTLGTAVLQIKKGEAITGLRHDSHLKFKLLWLLTNPGLGTNDTSAPMLSICFRIFLICLIQLTNLWARESPVKSFAFYLPVIKAAISLRCVRSSNWITLNCGKRNITLVTSLLKYWQEMHPGNDDDQDLDPKILYRRLPVILGCHKVGDPHGKVAS